MKKLLLLSALLIFACSSGGDSDNNDILNNQNLVDTWYTSFTSGVDLVYQTLKLEDQSTGSLRRVVVVDGEDTTVYYSDLVWSSSSTALTLTTSVDNNNETFNYVLSTNYEVSNDINTLTITGSDSSILVYTNVPRAGELDPDDSYATIDDLLGGLLASYNFLDTTYEIGFTSAMTDECYKGRDNGGQNSSEQNFNINSSNGYASGIWSSYYGAIGMANRVIGAGGSVERSEDPVEYDNIIGQAHAIRAFSHFQILTWFSTDYTDNDALAGLLLTSVTEDIYAQVPRSTNMEFYDQITLDLDTAEALITTDAGNKFLGLDAVNAIRARMHAYKGDYAAAKQYAATVLSNYEISNTTQFGQMFEDNDFTEVIFSLERAIADSYDGQGTAGGGWAGSLYAFVDATEQGGPFMEMSRSVFNILENNTSDVRYSRCLNVAESIIDSYHVNNDNFLNDDVLLVYKYPGGTQPLLNDLKVFRAAEMQLILAEAEADAGNFVQVGALINELRSKRGASSVVNPSTEQEAFGMILDERRLEFLFEGHRWIDLKRMGDRGGRALDRDSRECSFLAGCTLANTDYRFTLPIPVSETTANSAADQNPNY
jgi:hypothetical protein